MSPLSPQPTKVVPDFGDFARAVEAEIAAAEIKWPDNSTLHRLAALTGEVGELAEGVLKREPLKNLEHEAVQVAAMAFRALRAIRKDWAA